MARRPASAGRGDDAHAGPRLRARHRVPVPRGSRLPRTCAPCVLHRRDADQPRSSTSSPSSWPPPAGPPDGPAGHLGLRGVRHREHRRRARATAATVGRTAAATRCPRASRTAARRAAGVRQHRRAARRRALRPRRHALVVREDIGRHNAVDKVVGARLLAGDARAAGAVRQRPHRVRDRAEGGGRATTSEWSPSAHRTSLARSLAEDRPVLVGFVGPGRFVVYSVRDRVAEPACAGVSVGDLSYASWRAHPPHLRLAPGTFVPRRDARCPGGVRRPPDRHRRRERVDLVVVSGDVHDRALPPVDAVELADETFARLAASRAQVVVSSGNHDSPARLGFNARLADAAGRAPAHPLAGRRHAGAARRRARPVAVHGIPYLEPDAVRRLGAAGPPHHEAALTAAMDAGPRRPRRPAAGTRSVVMAHAFVAGAAAQRERAGHLRRRHPDRPDEPVHRRRLRGAGPPARPRDAHRDGPLQRLAAGLLLLRGRPHQGLLAGRPRRRRGLVRGSSRPRSPAAGPLRGTSTSCSPTRARARSRTPGCRSR